MGHGFKVVGIAARRVAAQMIQLKTVWNCPVKALIHKAVGKPLPALVSQASIALFVQPAEPVPTPRFGHDLKPNNRSLLVTGEESGVFPFAPAIGQARLKNDGCPSTTTTLTKAVGDDIVRLHSDLQSLCRAPGRTHSGAGVSHPLKSTKNRITTPKVGDVYVVQPDGELVDVKELL